MIITISGAHVIGKTTLCKQLEKVLKFKFCPIELKSAPIWEKFKFQDLSKLSFSEQLEIQKNILKYVLEKMRIYLDLYENVIFDRSLLDIIGYCYTLNPNNKCEADSLETFINEIYNEYYNQIVEELTYSYLLQPTENWLPNNTDKVFYTKFKQNQINNILIGIFKNCSFEDTKIIELWDDPIYTILKNSTIMIQSMKIKEPEIYNDLFFI